MEPGWIIMENTGPSELLSTYGKDIYDIDNIAEEIIAYTGQPSRRFGDVLRWSFDRLEPTLWQKPPASA
jgi:hypothetical protein